MLFTRYWQLVTYHFVHVVCTHLSVRQSLDRFDAYGHHQEHPPGPFVLPGFLSSFRP